MRKLAIATLMLGIMLGALVAVGNASTQDVMLEGRGQTATEPLYLPAVDSVISAKHAGRRNFIVRAYGSSDRPELLINTIGSYQGQRFLRSDQPVTLDIDADGPWQIQIWPVGEGGEPAFSGSGDAVSNRFSPPGRQAWEITHDGSRNFIVRAHCEGRRPQLVENHIGIFSGSKIIDFQSGSCFWEVQADGSWSLAPR